MLNKILNSQAKTVGAAAGILAISALISRVLGLVRDGLLSSIFGAGSDLDVYFAAFRIPDLVYSLLIAGGIVVAFLPLFTEYFSKDEKETWKFTSNVLNIFLLFLILLSLLLFIFAPSLMKLITPGFTPQQIDKASLLTRLMFLSPILLGLSSVFSGILQYFNRFLVYSLTPILYNLGIILGILFLAPHFGVAGVALGVILGAVLHFLIQIPSAISCGFRYQTIFNFKDPGIKKIFNLMIPRLLGTAGLQINLMAITAIASTLSVGALAIFNFANNLQHIPMGIIGVSFATASFPLLARTWANGQKEEFFRSFSSSFRQTLYLIIPVSVLMFILRNQIVGLILKHGQFTLVDAQLTAASLGLFSLSIFAFSLVPLLARAFFAFQDTKTPAVITFLFMIFNVIASLYFVRLLANPNGFGNLLIKFFSLPENQNIAVLGLPLAFSLAAIFNFTLLAIFLYKKIGNYRLEEIWSSAFKIILATVLMAGGAYFTIQAFSGIFSQTIIASLVAVLIYISATFLLKSPEIQTLKSKLFNTRC